MHRIDFTIKKYMKERHNFLHLGIEREIILKLSFLFS
jgi:hypothetical protein